MIALLAFASFASACVTVPAPIESHYNRGVDLYDQKKYADAIEEYKLALRENPDNLFARFNLAVVYQDLKEDDSALRLYREILAKTEDTNSRINISSILYKMGDKAEAFKELEQAANHNRDNPNPLSVWGSYLQQENQLDQALEKYKAAVKIDPKHAPTWHRMGNVYALKKEYDSAFEAYSKAVMLDPEEPAYLEALAGEYERRGAFMESANLLEQASVQSPDRADFYFKLGYLYQQERLYPQALNRYWSGLMIRDDDPSVHRNLLDIYLKLADEEKYKLEKIENQGSLAKNIP
jgi:superkiller protein 3